jgi:hypothetical protein
MFVVVAEPAQVSVGFDIASPDLVEPLDSLLAKLFHQVFAGQQLGFEVPPHNPAVPDEQQRMGGVQEPVDRGKAAGEPIEQVGEDVNPGHGFAQHSVVAAGRAG